MNSFRTNIIFGAIWSVLGQFGYVGVVLLTNIILARILSPYIFGQIGIVMFFIVLFNVFAEGGMGGALIRKKEATNQDYTTVFVFNIAISLVLFALLASFSGVISSYYYDDSLQYVIIASGALLIVNSFQLVHNIKLTRELKFKKKTYYSLVSVVMASIVGVIMAYNDFGVWSMVAIQLLNSAFLSILLWTFEGSFGKIIFSKSSFKELINFGANTSFALFINTAFDNIYQLVLGKYFSINHVGLFYQAKRLQDMPSAVVAVTASGVVYSSISQIQDDKERFTSSFIKILTIYTVIIGLVSTLAYIYSNDIILLLYGQKWIKATYYMKLLSISSFFLSITLINDLIFKVFDRTERLLQVMIIKIIVQVLSIILGVWLMDLDVLIYGFVLTSIVNFIASLYFSRLILKNINNNDIFDLIKVVIISVLLILAIDFIEELLNLQGMMTFILVPLIITLYILAVKFFKILNVIDELKLLLNRK